MESYLICKKKKGRKMFIRRARDECDLPCGSSGKQHPHMRGVKKKGKTRGGHSTGSSLSFCVVVVQVRGTRVHHR